MSPDKGARRRAAKRRRETIAVRMGTPHTGPPYVVLWHPRAEAERDASWPAREKVAMLHAAKKLEAEGARLPHPHCSAIQGVVGGLRELRPRGGRSRWRPIYRQVSPGTFVILAVGPEAQIDGRGFDAAVVRASRRLEQLDVIDRKTSARR
jgi:hypothetical protein